VSNGVRAHAAEVRAGRSEQDCVAPVEAAFIQRRSVWPWRQFSR
jgi:hypothetical protein